MTTSFTGTRWQDYPTGPCTHNRQAPPTHAGKPVERIQPPNLPDSMRHLNLIANWGIAVLTGLALLSLLLSPFIPSPLMVRVTLWTAVAVGLFYGLFFWGIGGFGWNTKADAAVSAARPSKLLSKPYLRAPFMSLVFFSFAWMGIGSGAPWILTIAIGNNSGATAVVDGWQSRTSRSCSRPTLQHVPLFMMGRRALCIHQSREADMPPGTTLRILGKVSVLGVSPTRIEW